MEITVKNLSFSYGAHRVLDGVSFTAQSGELLAVLGPNGVGKSTLFYCLLGLSRPGAGELLLDGNPIGALPPSALARQIAYVPQSHAPTFNYSVFDMVLMGTTARVGGLSAPGGEELRLADEALERVGITHLRGRGYLRVSGGERQLTLIARALAQQAKILIMDEPTASLDYGNQLRVLSCVKALTREGYTVVQSTHNPDHAFLFADRALALKDGRVAALGTPRDAMTESLIESLYGVRVRLRENEDGQLRCDPILDS
ncbi:MAG: ABC transporter ATP-binding protein [Oscillospiraceae bacterium]|jgi:iron complex transport system ATP-binding protein|nr:ABC transporter ATP-binding protein [Oscillospiraceae bacterium]